MSRILLVLASGLVAGGGASADPAPATLSTFSADDLASLVKLSKPALSSDGTRVALIVARADLARSGRDRSLVVIDTRSGAQRVVATGEVTSPAWSPRGTELAWLAPDAQGAVQITRQVFGAREAGPAVVTAVSRETGVRAFAWSPDGGSIAYLAPVTPVAVADGARLDHSFEASDSDYLGTSYLSRSRGPAPSCLWLAPIASGAARQLACNVGYIESLVWAADGKSVIINAHPGASIVSQRFGSIMSVDRDRGTLETLVPSPANVAGEAAMDESSQGVLAYDHFRGQDPWLHQGNVAVVSAGQIHEVTTGLDRHVLDFSWLPDGKGLLVEGRERDRMVLWTVSSLWAVSSRGAQRRLDLGTVNLSEDGFSLTHGGVAFIGTEPAQAPELYYMASVTSVPKRLTSFNVAASARHLGLAKTITWANDGYQQMGILTYPPDYHSDQSYPLLVNIHGGPHMSPQLTFNAESQFYAAAGWLVFEPNYRGGDGQGEAYRTAVVGDATAGPGRDIRAGLDAVRAVANVDGTRIAVTGYSYGGVMTAWLIGHHRDWCAAIAGGVVVDFKGYYDQSDTGIWIGSLLGSPHRPENRNAYREQSPTTYLDQANTPTLILQDAGDDNAPVGQAYELYHALKDNHTEASLVTFDVEGHDPDDPLREKQMAQRTLAWMNGHCSPAQH